MMNALVLIIVSSSVLSTRSVEATCITNSSCSPHGLCLHGSCFCRSPWGGPNCATIVLVQGSAVENAEKATTVESTPARSLQVTPTFLGGSSPAKPVSMLTNPSQDQSMAKNALASADSSTLQAQMTKLESQVNSMFTLISHHNGNNGDFKKELEGSVLSARNGSPTSAVGETALVKDADKTAEKAQEKAKQAGEPKDSHSPPPDHIKNEIDWEVQSSRMAAIQVMLVFGTILIVSAIVYFSELTAESLHAVLGSHDPWQVDGERPSPNIYRAIAVLKPSEIGWLNFSNFLFQAFVCIIMQLYIPITLMYQNLVMFTIAGLKDYSSMRVSWWFAMMLRTVGLFNLARLFATQTIREILDEYIDDTIVLSMVRVRVAHRKKNDELIQFVKNLGHEDLAKRIAAATMLRKIGTPGDHAPRPSDPEKIGEHIHIIDELCSRLGFEEDEDEDGEVHYIPVETDSMAKCKVCDALGVLAGPDDNMKVEPVLLTLLKSETDKEVIRRAEKALADIKEHGKAPEDEEVSAFWTAWCKFWVTVSLLTTIICATFLEVVVLIKVMVLVGSVEEVAMIVMAIFFVNDLDERVMKGQPLMKKIFLSHCREKTKRVRVMPVWVQMIASRGGVPLVTVILYAGLVMMVTVTWKNQYTGVIIG